MSSFTETYRSLLRICLEDGFIETNARTGSDIKIVRGGSSLRIGLTNGFLPTCGLRKTKVHQAAAEAAWCVLGHNHIDWLRKYTKVWDQFAGVKECANCGGGGEVGNYVDYSTSRCPNCSGTGKTYWLDAAYGWRMRGKFGVDQLAVALERLKKDPSDRRVWIQLWDAASDLVDDGQKTVPCPVGFTLSVVGGRLNSTLMIRSSDLYMGLPYDVMRHSFLMDMIAASLYVNLGVLRVMLAHPHLYERQWGIAESMTQQSGIDPLMGLPHWPVLAVGARPNDYVEYVREVEAAQTWPTFNPKSEVVA